MNFWQKLKKPIFCLAPMADVTDPAFRYIITKYSRYGGQNIGVYGKFTRPHLGIVGGPDVMWTEFVSADGLFKGGMKALKKDLRYSKAEKPIIAQFFTADPKMMEKAAQLAVKLGFDGIDINMGCPDKGVEKQGAGAKLIKNPKLARELIRAAKLGTTKACPKGTIGQIPVSVKTRIGWSKDELETWLPELLAEEPAVITIHARTRKELSLVPARWEHVKRAVEIRNKLKSKTLIFGNGDVKDLNDAKQRAKETGCDGVMIGRAIFGNPWLFSRRGTLRQIRMEEKLKVLVEHSKLFEKLSPEKSFAVMKKHFKAYVAGWDGAKELRMKLMETNNSREVAIIISEYLKSGPK
jgi:nifR3 family TIM-barrel protein